MIKNVALRTACIVLFAGVVTSVVPQGVAAGAVRTEAVVAVSGAVVVEASAEGVVVASAGEPSDHNPWG